MSTDHQNTKQKPSGKKAKRLSQKEQSERFIETARELEADENGNLFDQTIKKIIQSKQPSKDGA